MVTALKTREPLLRANTTRTAARLELALHLPPPSQLCQEGPALVAAPGLGSHLVFTQGGEPRRCGAGRAVPRCPGPGVGSLSRWGRGPGALGWRGRIYRYQASPARGGGGARAHSPSGSRGTRCKPAPPRHGLRRGVNCSATCTHRAPLLGPAARPVQ